MSAVMYFVGRKAQVSLMVSWLALILAGCGGSSDGGGLAPPPAPPPPPPPATAEAGGIWFGTFQLDGEDAQPAEGIVAEDGRFHFSVNNGEGELYGQLDVSGDTATGDFTAFVIIGDEDAAGSGTLELEVVSRTSLEGSFTLDLGDVGQGEGTVLLEYDPLYEREASLADIAGTYRDADDETDVFNITASGVFDQMDAESGCMLNGQFSVVDPEFNAYVVEAEISNCTGELTVLNGNDLNGLFYFDDTETPVLLVGGIHIEVPSVDAIVAAWTISERF